MAKPTDFTNFANQSPNYFPGQYLLEDDFELQHKYLSDRQLYHHQSLHLSGIIEGLDIVVIQNTKSVQIKSGSAIDSNGNLIILKEDSTFSDFKNLTDGELYIQYNQLQQNQQQKDVPDSYTRWLEKPSFGFASQTPQNSVKLAKLTIKDTISLDANVREYSGLSLPNPDSKALTLRSAGNANPNLAVLTGSLKIEGNLTVNGTISGTIDTINITSGILSVDRIPNLSADKINSGILTVDRIPNLSTSKITSGVLDVARIPNLSADKINSGILTVDRIPNLSTSKITSGVLDVARIPNLSADKITSGTIQGNLTINGAITPSVGSAENNGIIFPKDPGGGGGDAAWIRYYSRNPNSTDVGLKEQLTLEIGIANDGNDHIALMPAGGVGIGTNNAGDYKLNVQGNQLIQGNLTVNANLSVSGKISGKIDRLTSSNGQYFVAMQDDRNLCISSTSGGNPAWCSGTNVSDINLKTDISEIFNPLDKLLSLRGISFSWKDKTIGESREIGVIAQEVEQVFPELVKVINGEQRFVQYDKFVPILIEAIRQQQQLISELREDIKRIDAK